MQPPMTLFPFSRHPEGMRLAKGISARVLGGGHPARLLPALLAVHLLHVIALAAPFPTTTQPVATQSAARIVQFKPGLRINYPAHQIELDAKVCMRSGLLELFACSPNTREYESIIVTGVRPLFVYQAMGLLGLTPGKPLRMLPTGQIEPATGQLLELQIAWDNPSGTHHIAPIETWLRPAKQTAPLEPQAWVFAGSFPLDNGGIAADEEGAIVAVVDFESAIIAIPRHHTASNAELWLEPNTPAIPPLGTPCTLIIRPGPWRLRLDQTGRLYLDGKPVTLAQVARQLQDALYDAPDTRVELEVLQGCPPEDRRHVTAVLDALHVHPVNKSTTQPALTTQPTTQPSDAHNHNDNTALLRWAGDRLFNRAR